MTGYQPREKYGTTVHSEGVDVIIVGSFNARRSLVILRNLISFKEESAVSYFEDEEGTKIDIEQMELIVALS